MSAADTSWLGEFGIGSTGPSGFFASKADLVAHRDNVPQSHILHRAFDLLKLDGVLCAANTPLVYFKSVRRIDQNEIADLHHKFWNHGGAPLLAVVSPAEVHVYSGFTKPAPASSLAPLPSLVQVIQRASSALKEFLHTVESGEYFRTYQKSFTADQRVDRDLLDNLQATRAKLVGQVEDEVLDALLCRLVFVCYLFDRGAVGRSYLEAIGLPNIKHLRDVLGMQPRSVAKKCLYDLFRALGKDFNGDLFSDDLDAEARKVSVSYFDSLNDFFQATDVEGQTSFWPYDFSAIPIETISAIYERFLKASNKKQGAFYTPRFLAELVLDLAHRDKRSLLDQRYLDPACGSGIFLVGLFNRVAQEWRDQNPHAKNDHRARELRKILCKNIYGVDINPTACRITAFSLYLAYLDQLSPRDIQELKDKGHKLPRLVHYPHVSPAVEVEGNIWCNDFFDEAGNFPVDVDLVLGNPPWGSLATEETSAAKWCDHADRKYPIPDAQISTAFAWKAPLHASKTGKVCLVLPHGTLFNHSNAALKFQEAFFSCYAVDHVLNLADYQFFLFEEAQHPAIVLAFRETAPTPNHKIDYWGPKTDWLVTRAEVISVMPQDRCTVTVREVIEDLKQDDAPQIWKQHYWGTPRDWRLVRRLSDYPRLRDYVRRQRESDQRKPWQIAEGYQPLGENDDPKKAKLLELPSNLFIEATSKDLELFLRPEDCTRLRNSRVTLRDRSNSNTDVFKGPHVLVAKGFTRIAFADFDVSFRHALRGISGPKKDRRLLVFLAAFLRSPLAKYFLFQTSTNWGVSRQEVHVEELLRLPFILPNSSHNPEAAWRIVERVNEIVSATIKKADHHFVDRREIVRSAEEEIALLIDEYFDVLPTEKILVSDTLRVIVPSLRPSRARSSIPTIEPSKPEQRAAYTKRLCDTLNGWSSSHGPTVRGNAIGSAKLGIGLAILQKGPGDGTPQLSTHETDILLATLHQLHAVVSQRLSMFQLLRGTTIFERDCLYLVKPVGQRFWTESAAMNDADEIAGTILMKQPQVGT